ncbi:serine/threonine-protein phosphatase 6 regulatory ankyrin repeat subunit B-like [Trichogramma pretiosum]|uniref:serine/threonine-protein phosphatase 6 regulatory ankyrin repeat subunit B-like n=1 Tax=Trichogramma pretiosum TaxID=7493 RepID=UPI0006C9A846|nr:serine/threonine-protein phosphatase 6 regulatory ankyrin repeat subunit B-like [Trichogramma pretiosum]
MANEAWKSWIHNVNWDWDRRSVLNVLYGVAQMWQNSLPDLSSLPAGLVECLLSHTVTDHEGDEEARIRFIKFVVDTGYRDQPKIGPDGRYVLRRTTPIHLVLRTKINNWDATATNMVQLLFEIYDRFDLNYTDEGGFTHFQAACFIPNGHQLVRKFLQNGQNPNFFVNGYSLLRSALQNDTKWARELLIRGADPTCVDTDGSTSLHTICRDGRVELLQSFFEVVDYHRKPVQINVRDSLGNTPLHLAVESGNVTTFELLLARGADPNSANQERSTPLHLICQRVKKDKLIASFFKVTDENRQTVQVNVRDRKGNTPLHLTLKNSNTWASEILLKRGADVNSVNEEGSTPLHIICQQLQADLLVETFLRINDRLGKTVQINAQDKGLNTPLHLAILHCKKKATAILLSRGADPNLADKDRCTAMHLELSKIHQL